MIAPRGIGFFAWLAASLLWTAAVAGWLVVAWPRHVAPVEAEYRGRETFCTARYAEPAARDRCVIIMDLERFQARSIMLFNRALLVAGPPLLGLGVLVYGRRARASRAATRKGRR